MNNFFPIIYLITRVKMLFDIFYLFYYIFMSAIDIDFILIVHQNGILLKIK